MASASGSPTLPKTVRDGAPLLAFALGLLCLLAMVPVTLGALAGYLAIGAAVPALAVGAVLAVLSLVAA